MLWQLLQHSVALLTIANVFFWENEKTERDRKKEEERRGGWYWYHLHKQHFYLYITASLLLNEFFMPWQQLRCCRIMYFILAPTKQYKSKIITNICLHSSVHNTLDVNISNGFLWRGESKQPSARKSWLQWHNVSIQLQLQHFALYINGWLGSTKKVHLWIQIKYEESKPWSLVTLVTQWESFHHIFNSATCGFESVNEQ